MWKYQLPIFPSPLSYISETCRANSRVSEMKLESMKTQLKIERTLFLIEKSFSPPSKPLDHSLVNNVCLLPWVVSTLSRKKRTWLEKKVSLHIIFITKYVTLTIVITRRVSQDLYTWWLEFVSFTVFITGSCGPRTNDNRLTTWGSPT